MTMKTQNCVQFQRNPKTSIIYLTVWRLMTHIWVVPQR